MNGYCKCGNKMETTNNECIECASKPKVFIGGKEVFENQIYNRAKFGEEVKIEELIDNLRDRLEKFHRIYDYGAGSVEAVKVEFLEEELDDFRSALSGQSVELTPDIQEWLNK